MEEVDAADRDRAQRVAVVGVAQGDERGAPRRAAAALVPVLERHLQRDLGRGRARVRVEDAAQARRARARPAARPARRRPDASGPSIVEWATRSSCSRIAGVDQRDGGARGRCTTATRRRRCSDCPSASIRSVPSARSITSGSSRHQSRCWVNGCQRWRWSSSARPIDHRAGDPRPRGGGTGNRASGLRWTLRLSVGLAWIRRGSTDVRRVRSGRSRMRLRLGSASDLRGGGGRDLLGDAGRAAKRQAHRVRRL